MNNFIANKETTKKLNHFIRSRKDGVKILCEAFDKVYRESATEFANSIGLWRRVFPKGIILSYVMDRNGKWRAI